MERVRALCHTLLRGSDSQPPPSFGVQCFGDALGRPLIQVCHCARKATSSSGYGRENRRWRVRQPLLHRKAHLLTLSAGVSSVCDCSHRLCCMSSAMHTGVRMHHCVAAPCACTAQARTYGSGGDRGSVLTPPDQGNDGAAWRAQKAPSWRVLHVARALARSHASAKRLVCSRRRCVHAHVHTYALAGRDARACPLAPNVQGHGKMAGAWPRHIPRVEGGQRRAARPWTGGNARPGAARAAHWQSGLCA